MSAIYNNHKDIVEFWLNHGADSTFKAYCGKTCLDIAQSKFMDTSDHDKKRIYKEIGKLLLNAYIERRKRPVKEAVHG